MSRSLLRANIVLSILLFVGLACADSTRDALEGPPDPSGAQVFADNCAACHTLPLMAYQFPQMKGRPPGFVYDALTTGPMRRIGRNLDEASRHAVAEFFTGVDFGTPESERDYAVSPTCEDDRLAFDWNDRAHPSWGGSLLNHRNVASNEG